MAWLAVDKFGNEYISDGYPERGDSIFDPEGYLFCIGLPKGSIKKLIGKELTWKDKSVQLK